MPALLTSASIDLKRDSAASTILAAVAGSPMWPSTRATWLEAATSVDWVTFRELATTLKPRSTNAFTMPAPIPCEAPVTMAVFCAPLIVAYLENVLSPGPHQELSGRPRRALPHRPGRGPLQRWFRPPQRQGPESSWFRPPPPLSPSRRPVAGGTAGPVALSEGRCRLPSGRSSPRRAGGAAA